MIGSLPQLSARQILKTWWPLAFSWLLMSVEIPVLSAVIARLANPEINLAAYGGIVYPLALIIEAPVIMLLGASVALSKHRQAYLVVWRYMVISGALLTLLHILIVFTPLYYLVVENWIGVPAQVVEPARLGLMIMVPWTWAIGYRRFQQGILIRYGHSGAVGIGTIVRLIADGLALAIGYSLRGLPGIVVAASAQTFGVLCEAIYAGWCVRPVVKHELPAFTSADSPLTWRAFADFYIPLALTSLISLVGQPVGSAALSRMPDPLSSLAVWPVLSGLSSLLRSFGIAYNEVVVALLDRERAWPSLRRFTNGMALAVSALALLIAATPLARLYFSNFSALPPNLAHLAQTGFWIALPMPALAVFQNWYQGSILYGKRTRAVPESVLVFFATVLVVLLVGIAQAQWAGIYVVTGGFVLANIAQAAWLWFRSGPVMQTLSARDTL